VDRQTKMDLFSTKVFFTSNGFELDDPCFDVRSCFFFFFFSVQRIGCLLCFSKDTDNDDTTNPQQTTFLSMRTIRDGIKKKHAIYYFFLIINIRTNLLTFLLIFCILKLITRNIFLIILRFIKL
jgi:hypothetical protein